MLNGRTPLHAGVTDIQRGPFTQGQRAISRVPVVQAERLDEEMTRRAYVNQQFKLVQDFVVKEGETIITHALHHMGLHVPEMPPFASSIQQGTAEGLDSACDIKWWIAHIMWSAVQGKQNVHIAWQDMYSRERNCIFSTRCHVPNCTCKTLK